MKKQPKPILQPPERRKPAKPPPEVTPVPAPAVVLKTVQDRLGTRIAEAKPT